MLSDLGADVVKVEPPEGDVSRVWGEVRHGLSGFFTQQNAGKRNVCIDLAAPGGPGLVGRLAARADVLIENFRPGVLGRWGLGWEALSAANPGLVMLSITGFGQDGPWRDRRAYAPIVHAESGLLWRQARFDGTPPSDPMLSVADTYAGLHGLVAVQAALWLRQRTGRGQRIDLAMLDAMLATDDYAHHALDGSAVERLGGQVWEGAGQPVLLAGSFRYLWRQVSTVHGLADPTPPGASLEDKVEHRRRAFGEWMRSFSSKEELVAALEGADLAWADIRAPEEAFASPPALSRAVAAEVDDRGGGSRRVVQSPYRFSEALSGVRGGAAHRGEHNEQVLADWLGSSPAEVAELERSGVLRAVPEGRPPRRAARPGPGGASGSRGSWGQREEGVLHEAEGRDAPQPGPSAPGGGPYVAVVGGGSADADEEQVAEAVGRAVAQAGAVLVCGGLGGVMEAACRGARLEGGLTVGLLPGTDRGDANPYLSVALPTGMGELRNGLVVRAADAVVAVGGGYGTLSEIALALRTGRPVVGLGTWELTRGGGQPDDAVLRADGPDAAVGAALSAARRARCAAKPGKEGAPGA